VSAETLPLVASTGVSGVAAIRLFMGDLEGGDIEAVRGAAAGVEAVHRYGWQ
jgi:hypothetical protein